MIKILLLLTVVGACGGAGNASSKTSTLTCKDAGKKMAELFEFRAETSPEFRGHAVEVAEVTMTSCTADRWSAGAIYCVARTDRVDGPASCMQAGRGVDDKLGCPFDAKTPYGPGCTGFKKDQADAYQEALLTRIHCDLGMANTARTQHGIKCK